MGGVKGGELSAVFLGEVGLPLGVGAGGEALGGRELGEPVLPLGPGFIEGGDPVAAGEVGVDRFVELVGLGGDALAAGEPVDDEEILEGLVGAVGGEGVELEQVGLGLEGFVVGDAGGEFLGRQGVEGGEVAVVKVFDLV